MHTFWQKGVQRCKSGHFLPFIYLENTKSPCNKGSRIVSILLFTFGGGGGSRTRVRRPSHKSIYGCSPDFYFRSLVSSEQDATLLSPFSFPGLKQESSSSRVACCYDAHSFPAGEEKVNELLYIKQLMLNYRWQL